MAQYRRIWTAFALACGLAAGTARGDDRAIPTPDDPAWNLCAETALQVEGEFNIPAYLLKAVALTETGRSGGPGRRVASWPWTVHDGSQGHYFATREAAIAFVREIRTDGRRSIDVGCMQINLRHHPRAFTSVAAGFDPAVNVRYAAEFLRQLREASGSWEAAIARYHSYTPGFDDYAGKVMAYWQGERQKATLLTPLHPTPAPVVATAKRPTLVLASAEPGFGRNVIAGSDRTWPPAGVKPGGATVKTLVSWQR